MNASSVSNTPDVIDLDFSSNSTDIQQTASSSSSNSPYLSSHSSDVSSYSQYLSAEIIATNLNLNKKQWIIVDVKNKKSDCRQCFGIPARKLNEKYNEILDNFVSCKYCYLTYSFSSSTRNMNKHMQVCDGFNSKQIHFTTSSEINRSPVIEISTSSTSSSSNNKNLEVHKQKMTHLLAEWICCNIRPISAVEDIGFKKLIEEATPIGTCRIKSYI
jgi:hypothetical protein